MRIRHLQRYLKMRDYDGQDMEQYIEFSKRIEG